MNATQTIARVLTTGHSTAGALCMSLMFFMFTAIGCETTSDPDQATLPPMPSGKITRLPATGPSTIGQVIVDQIYIPRSTRLEPLLAEINENGFDEGVDEQQRAAWNANEIQAFRLNAVELSQLYKAIDQGSSMRRNRHAITQQDLLFETTPELKHAVSIDWAAKPNLDQTVRLPAGRTRFLGNVSFKNDDAKITLTPQHHWVHQTLIPRPPLEKVRDGRVFDELTLAADLPANTYLVIFWNRSDEAEPEPEPEPEPDNTLPVKREDDNSNPPAGNSNARNEALEIDNVGTVQPVTPGTPATPGSPDNKPDQQTEGPKEGPFKFELPPALPRLGRLLLTGDRSNKRLQLVLVVHSPIRVQRNDDLRAPGTEAPPEPTTPSAPTTPAAPPPPPVRERSPR